MCVSCREHGNIGAHEVQKRILWNWTCVICKSNMSFLSTSVHTTVLKWRSEANPWVSSLLPSHGFKALNQALRLAASALTYGASHWPFQLFILFSFQWLLEVLPHFCNVPVYRKGEKQPSGSSSTTGDLLKSSPDEYICLNSSKPTYNSYSWNGQQCLHYSQGLGTDQELNACLQDYRFSDEETQKCKCLWD